MDFIENYKEFFKEIKLRIERMDNDLKIYSSMKNDCDIYALFTSLIPNLILEIKLYYLLLAKKKGLSIKKTYEYVDSHIKKYINEEEFFLPKLSNIAETINNTMIYILEIFKEKNISHNSLLAKTIYTYFIFLADEQIKKIEDEINVNLEFDKLYKKYLCIKSRKKKKELRGNFRAYFIQLKSCNRSVFSNYITKDEILYKINPECLILYILIESKGKDVLNSNLLDDLNKMGISQSDLDNALNDENYFRFSFNITGFTPNSILGYLQGIEKKIK